MGGGVIKLKGPLAAPGMFADYFFFSDSCVGRDGYRRSALPAQIQRHWSSIVPIFLRRIFHLRWLAIGPIEICIAMVAGMYPALIITRL